MVSRKISKLSIILVLLSCFHYSSQQYWKNDKIVKNWEQMVPLNFQSSQNVAPPVYPSQSESYGNQPPPPPVYQSQSESYGNQQPPINNQVPPQSDYLFNSNPYQPQPINLQPNLQPVHPTIVNPPPVQPVVVNPPPVLPSLPVHPAVLPVGPFAIQQPTITNTGETIIENLIGGIPFDCHGRPTGHWRDNKFCDIFHACVFGQQRKTYSCPFVGERTYFDDITRRCEFVSRNPLGCASNAYYH